MNERRRVGRAEIGTYLRPAAALAFCLASCLSLPACDGASPEPAGLAFVDAGTSHLRLGLTHTQESVDPWSAPEAAARAEAWLSKRTRLQNQHLMGWGTLNPEPEPGRYDWDRLDERMDLIRRTGGIPVLTLCCAPDWMKGGRAGETDWSNLEDAPLPEHYDAFAALAGEAAARYPDVVHFQVWNEMKGFYLREENRWDAEGYTAMYNRVHEAVKSVRPEARIGGPYVVMDSWASRDRMSHPSDLSGPWGVLDQRSLDVVSYWLEHRNGADFVAVDFGTHTRDAGLITDPFTATRKFVDVVAWIRERTDLPIWLSEWYIATDHENRALQTAVMMTAVIEMARAGVDVALQWGPQEDAGSCVVGGCLWTDTEQSGGGHPTALAAGFDAFGTAFPPGTRLFDVQGLPDGVAGLASPHDILLVNQRGDERTLQVGSRSVVLGPYEIALAPRDGTPAR